MPNKIYISPIMLEVLTGTNPGLQNLSPYIFQENRPPVSVLALPGIVEDIVESRSKVIFGHERIDCPHVLKESAKPWSIPPVALKDRFDDRINS